MAYGEYVGSFFGMFIGTIIAVWKSNRSENYSPDFMFLLMPLFALSLGSHGLRTLECWLTGNKISGVTILATLGGVLLSIAIGIFLATMLMNGIMNLKKQRIS
ncbi:hypothetical protein [Xanthomarina sp. F2636L]|uniref:hypothetical protein n=1 Tax=Xanthomarina sp. F2636L TaxID=2996018 RepID=UPI00225DF040|nr:hypothetical protein [Xanthomarina sp. F2636L]MCX7549476.1 hypothetical protein [Xanthomarina sp. F2636L]